MVTGHWDQLYGRPSIPREGILLAVALLLHTPLLLLKMNAPAKVKKGETLINVTMIEGRMDQIIQSAPIPRPLVNPENVLNLQAKIAAWRGSVPPLPVPAPVIPAPVNISGIRTGPVGGPVTGPSTTPSIPIENNIPDPGLGGTFPTDVGPRETKKWEDKKVFQGGGESTVSSIGGNNSLRVGGPSAGAITLPVEKVETFEETTGPKVGRVAPSIQIAMAPKVDSAEALLKSGKDRASVISDPINPAEMSVDQRPMVVGVTRSSNQSHRESQFPIVGPLANRKLLYQEAPTVPEWFRSLGVDAVVLLRFKVRVDGRVRDEVDVVKGSGYLRLDEHAKSVLRRWVFVPLEGETRNLEEVGTVEFKFSVK